MGMNATARLIYGIDFGDEPIFPDDDEDEEFETKVARIYGPDLKEPEGEPVDWKDKTDPLVIAYHAYWDAKRDAIKDVPVDQTWHGSDGYSCNAIYIEESYKAVDYGNSLELGQSIEAKPEWRQQMLDFCTKMGIEFKEPQYLLLAYWG